MRAHVYSILLMLKIEIFLERRCKLLTRKHIKRTKPKDFNGQQVETVKPTPQSNINQMRPIKRALRQNSSILALTLKDAESSMINQKCANLHFFPLTMKYMGQCLMMGLILALNDQPRCPVEILFWFQATRQLHLSMQK